MLLGNFTEVNICFFFVQQSRKKWFTGFKCQMLEFERRVSYYMKLGNYKKSFCKIKYKFPKYFENNIQRRAETLGKSSRFWPMVYIFWWFEIFSSVIQLEELNWGGKQYNIPTDVIINIISNSVIFVFLRNSVCSTCKLDLNNYTVA